MLATVIFMSLRLEAEVSLILCFCNRRAALPPERQR